MLLSQEWLEQQTDVKPIAEYPERILQIGEGNFLRGFVDWLLHQLVQSGNYQGRVVVATPLAIGAQNIENLNAQNGLYTVWLRGMQNGQVVDSKQVMSVVSRGIDTYGKWEDILACARNPVIDVVVSNTTEAGLAYVEEPLRAQTCPTSYPAKLTAYLYERYQAFAGNPAMGIDIVPCELVENNGDLLRAFVLQYISAWGLPDSFADWVRQYNYFYNTLVDRIVTGFSAQDPNLIKSEVPYEDQLGIVCEPFHLWVIQGPPRLQEKWNFAAAGLNVRYVPDVAPHRLIKVRMLNGAHTALAGLARLAGLQTVKDVITHDVLGTFVQRLMREEIIPALAQQNVPPSDANPFAQAVIERFANPLLRHEVMSLQLNALSKISVRLLPTFNDYLTQAGQIPRLLTMAVAGQFLFYKNATDPALRWDIKDNAEHVQAIQSAWALEESEGLAAAVMAILRQQEIWGQDLSLAPGLAATVVEDIVRLRADGVVGALSKMLSD